MAPTRMRMRPWLEIQINSEEIPGLRWVNKDEKIFEIPWKHGARHGWEMKKDACLFEKWAIHTGRYKIGEKIPDPKTWKANFRCAMNSLPDIKEVKDKSVNKGNSAVRVYQIFPVTATIERKERKSKPCRDSKKKISKMECEDNCSEHRSDARLNNSIDEHGRYSDHSYSGQEMEIHSTSTSLSAAPTHCDTSSLASTGRGLEISVADSTNDLYPFQVSPSSSCSSAIEDEKEESILPEEIIKMIYPTPPWHQANVDGKGYLSNEAGVHFSDLSSRDPPAEFEKMAGEIEFRFSTDMMKATAEIVSWLDPNYGAYLPAISCTY